MSFGSYFRRNFGEFLLVVISAWAVSTVSMNAFFLDSVVAAIGWWGRAVLCLAASAVLVLVLYAGSFRRSHLLVGILFFIAIAAMMVAIAMGFSSGESIYEDVEGNYLYMALVLIGVSALAFALTRTLVGGTIWFVVAAFICSAVQALYQNEELALSVVASFAALALIVYRNFKLGLEKADQASGSAQRGGLTSAVVPVAAVFSVALAVWFGIIAPLNPGVLDIKLITEYRAFPIDEYKGVAEERSVFNYDLTTQNLVEGRQYTTDDLVEDPTSSKIIDAMSLFAQQWEQEISGSSGDVGEQSGGGTTDTLDMTSQEEELDAQSYTYRFPWIILQIIAAVLVIAGVVYLFIWRRGRRRRRLERMLALPPNRQVQEIYRFILERLRRIGFTVPVGMTLTEYAETSRRNMEMLTEETRVPFDEITETYTACTYGEYEPDEEEIVPLVAYYLGFWKAARTQLGNIRYFFKSFRL